MYTYHEIFVNIQKENIAFIVLLQIIVYCVGYFLTILD